jgi:hypothetical protein
VVLKIVTFVEVLPVQNKNKQDNNSTKYFDFVVMRKNSLNSILLSLPYRRFLPSPPSVVDDDTDAMLYETFLCKCKKLKENLP